MNSQFLQKMWPRVYLTMLCMVAVAAADPDTKNLVFYLSCDDAVNPIDESADPATTVLHGSLISVPGQFGTHALGFNGNKANRIQVLNNPKLDGMSGLTIEAWIQTRNLASHAGMGIVSKRVSNSVSDSYSFFFWYTQHGPHIVARVNTHGFVNWDVVGKTAIRDDTWYHVAFVFDGKAPADERMKVYVNGVLDGTLSHPDTRVVRGNASLWIGDEGESETGFTWDGALDEIGIWNTALTAEDIGQLMVWSKASMIAKKGTADNPQPSDGAINSETWSLLSWIPGYFAVSHDVYFGESFDDVNDATLESEIFRGNQTDTFLIAGLPGFIYPDGLVPGTTYYWRIDEGNDADPNSPWKGNVWSFLVPPKTAYDPLPSDGSIFINPADVTLSWTPGLKATLHTVYFGDDHDTVTNAAAGIPITLAAYNPGFLEGYTTYYWRVDEYDGITTYKGDIWSFTTGPNIPVTDPTLIGWWKLDEGQGTTAVDWSGHSNHGTIEGSVHWAERYNGGALEFDGSYARVIDDDGDNFLNGLNALTIALWIKSDLTGTDKGFIDGEEPDGSDNVCTIRYDAAGAVFGGTNVMKMAVTSDPGGGKALIEQQLESSSNIQTTEWQHVAMTWESGGLIRLYVNGIEDTPTGRTNPNNAGTVSACTAFIIGQGGKDTYASWDGLIDDVRVYNRVLTLDEIAELAGQ